MSSPYHHPERASAAPILVLAAVALAGCHEEQSNSSLPAAQETAANVPVGGIFPNGGKEPSLPAIARQYEGNAQAINQGSRLFDWYNCSGCHFHGAGGIGPAFDDQQWIYGGRLDQIYASIAQGRPNGMPMWGNVLSSATIWQLAAYVKSLSANAAKEPIPTKPVAGVPGPATLETEPTENPSPLPAASK